MTDQERALIMQARAEEFLREADAKYNGAVKVDKETMTAELLGVCAGAMACMLASDVPAPIIAAALASVLQDMIS